MAQVIRWTLPRIVATTKLNKIPFAYSVGGWFVERSIQDLDQQTKDCRSDLHRLYVQNPAKMLGCQIPWWPGNFIKTILELVDSIIRFDMYRLAICVRDHHGRRFDGEQLVRYVRDEIRDGVHFVISGLPRGVIVYGKNYMVIGPPSQKCKRAFDSWNPTQAWTTKWGLEHQSLSSRPFPIWIIRRAFLLFSEQNRKWRLNARRILGIVHCRSLLRDTQLLFVTSCHHLLHIDLGNNTQHDYRSFRIDCYVDKVQNLPSLQENHVKASL